MQPSAPFPAPAKRPKATPWIIIALVLLSFMGLMALLTLSLVGSSLSSDRIGLIEVSGAISDEGASGFLGGTQGGARAFLRDVAKARDDDSIKAVVIRINSPGGSSSASQEMYQAVRRLRTKKPVVASMGDVAASGGYYIAAACDKIYANPSTLTGSIGVISQMMNYQDLFKKVGLDTTVIKSGKFKDAGNPARPLTAEEKAYFQKMVMDVYGQFVNDVLAGRKAPTNGKLTRPKLLAIADGRVLTGSQAKLAMLVDENGGLYDALHAAASLGHITYKGEPEVKQLSRGSGLSALFGTDSSSPVAPLAHEAGREFAAGAVEGLKAEAQNVPSLR